MWEFLITMAVGGLIGSIVLGHWIASGRRHHSAHHHRHH